MSDVQGKVSTPWDANALGKAINGRRRGLGMTQRALASSMGVTAGLVSQWELGRTRVPGNDLGRLARALGTTAVDLVSDAHLIEYESGGETPKVEGDDERLRRQEQLLLSEYRLLDEGQREMALRMIRVIRVAEKIEL